MMRLLAAALLLSASATGLTWLETSHSDFNEGSFSDNLYASFRDGGTVEFTTRLDLNNDGFIDVACPDMSGPSLTVYFGDSSGFSPSRSRALPAGSGGEYAIADLNWDNRAELVLGGWHTGECIIYWGSDTGPSRQNTTVLPSNTSEAITVADLDRDGYPDLILPGEAPPSVTIYWGSAQGYSTGRASEVYIGSGLGHRTVVADINRDGYLDMTVCCVCDNTRQPIVYWGANRTYRIEWLDFVGIHGWCGHGNALADLDGNGWLDVVLTGFNVVTQSYIYFGDSTGFSTSRRTIVSPGNSVGGSSAWDLDDDGDLDLIYFRGNGMLGGGAKPPLIYWNSRSAPFFRDTDTLQAGSIALNAHGGMVADFDGDANVDVLVNCTGTSSVVLWGPDWTRTTSLPCHDSHHGPQLDLGNVYDRGFAETYTSSVLDAAFVCNWGRVSWVDSVPPSASVTMSLRTGNTPSPDPSWSPWTALMNGDTVADALNARCIQYRTTLAYANPACLPLLKEVRVDYAAANAADVGVTAVIAPTGTVDSGTVVVPRATVRNYTGSAAVFPVTMRIGTGYLQNRQESLPGYGTRDVSFPAWIARPRGTHAVTCWTWLASDTNQANDTARATVTVGQPAQLDVGVTAIVAPTGSVDSGTIVRPRAVCRNFGLVDTVFPVTMLIGTGYSRTVLDTLRAGASDTVTFPVWTAAPLGTYPVTCYTLLAGDGNRANDTARAQVTVVRRAVHDIGASVILSPPTTLYAGDSVVPKAIVRNYGTAVERYFDVRFRIGVVYDRVVTVNSDLLPNGTVDVTFPAWVAQEGYYPASCSTMLARDTNRLNDKTSIDIAVLPPVILRIEWDQSEHLLVAERKDVSFYAELDARQSDVIELRPPTAPPGWSATLYDSGGLRRLPDTDADGLPDLGPVQPSRRAYFAVRVEAPANLVGEPGRSGDTVVVRGFTRRDSTVDDSALLILRLAPDLAVHNFPNPFSHKTTFVFGLPELGTVTLTVYDRAGERICRLLEAEDYEAGIWLQAWDGTNDDGLAVAPGTYDYVFEYDAAGRTRRLVKKLVVTRE